MQRKYFLLVFCCLVTVSLVAQNKKTKHYQFRSVNSLALVNGSNATAIALQSVNGFKKGAWFAGIGVGLDYYLYRTVPVFADIRYEFGKSKNKVFVYADGGYNIEWVNEYSTSNGWFWNTTGHEFHNGFYTDAGLGCAVGMKNGEALVLSVGHSHKYLEETITTQGWEPGPQPGPTAQTSLNRYRLNRIVVRIGWRF